MLRLIVSAALVVTCVMILGRTARAQLIVGDGFNDTPGAITNDTGGVGWPNDGDHNWFTEGGPNADQVTVGGLNFAAGGNALAVSGNGLTTVGGNTGAFRNLPGSFGGDVNQTLWISFLASDASAANQDGYAGLSLIDAYTDNGVYTQAENFFIGQVNGTGQYGFVNSSPGNSNGSALLSGTTTDTATHFLATRFDFTASGATEVSLYVDPTPGVMPTGDPQALEDYTDGFVFDQFRFQSGSAAGASYNFDELRLGSTYADVAPIAAPEPAENVVVGVGLSLLSLSATRGRSRKRV